MNYDKPKKLSELCQQLKLFPRSSFPIILLHIILYFSLFLIGFEQIECSVLLQKLSNKFKVLCMSKIPCQAILQSMVASMVFQGLDPWSQYLFPEFLTVWRNWRYYFCYTRIQIHFRWTYSSNECTTTTTYSQPNKGFDDFFLLHQLPYLAEMGEDRGWTDLHLRRGFQFC